MTWGLESACVRFGSQTALDNVTLSAEPSTVSIIVGGDGAGKSTLLRALVGLVRLSSGISRRPAKREIGYVPATAGLYTDLTVDENLAFSGGAYGVVGSELASRSAELLERIGLARCPEPARCAALGRHAAQAGGRDGASPSTGPAGSGRADHRGGPGKPVRAVAPHLRGRGRGDRRCRGDDICGRGPSRCQQSRCWNRAGRSQLVPLPEIVAAVGGELGVVRSAAQPPGFSWRWGRTWRVWSPSNVLPEGAEALKPGFEDAVIIASLRDEQAVSARGRARRGPCCDDAVRPFRRRRLGGPGCRRR